jgi:hypothetical protein
MWRPAICKPAAGLPMGGNETTRGGRPASHAGTVSVTAGFPGRRGQPPRIDLARPWRAAAEAGRRP